MDNYIWSVGFCDHGTSIFNCRADGIIDADRHVRKLKSKLKKERGGGSALSNFERVTCSKSVC